MQGLTNMVFDPEDQDLSLLQCQQLIIDSLLILFKFSPLSSKLLNPKSKQNPEVELELFENRTFKTLESRKN